MEYSQCFSNQVIEIVFNVMYVFILLILKQTPNENKPDGCTVTTAVNKSVFLKEALSTISKEGTQPAFSSFQYIWFTIQNHVVSF